MIVLKSARELEIMKEAGRISAGALMEVGKYVRPGVSTLDILQPYHSILFFRKAFNLHPLHVSLFSCHQTMRI